MPTSRPEYSPTRPIDPSEFTPCFSWRDGRLMCEGVALDEIAEKQGTPAYVYSRGAIEAAYRRYERAFRSVPTTICYSVKANSNISLLRVLARLGSGFDIVSSGELYRLLRARISPRLVVFSGVGKSREEIREALRARILLFNVESEEELEILMSEAGRLGRRAPAAIRVNPDVEAGGHRHIATGHHQHKFGLDWNDARRIYRAYRDARWLNWTGIGAHIGSQILQLEPVRKAITRMADFTRELRHDGLRLSHIDFGGGVGVRYTSEQPLDIAEYARVVVRAVKPFGCHLLLEPGRSIAAGAGVLLMRVRYTKSNRGKHFIVVDAGINDFIRPALYGAVHPVTPVVRETRSRKMIRADIVGPVCESGDCFLRDWPIEEVGPGDVLALWGAGAYGFVQANNYNSRTRPAEILVEGRKARVIRRRESRADLVRGE